MSHPVHHLPDPQRYAVAQERQRHDGALWSFGEYAMFVLLWNITDHDAGLVERCGACFTAYGKIAEAYGQPAVNSCDACYGTTFEGGFKARIVRPSLWDFNEADYKDHARGEVTISTASIQSTGDFRMRTGDIIIRANGTRWKMRSLGTNHLRTGFETPAGPRTAIGYNYGQATLEDTSSVSHLIPPTDAVVTAALDVSMERYPRDFSALEVVRGALQ